VETLLTSSVQRIRANDVAFSAFSSVSVSEQFTSSSLAAGALCA
jgi:hypothetical protein